MNPIDLSRLHALRMACGERGERMAAMRPRFEALRTRHEDGTAPRAVAAWQLFQTPPTLAARMVELANPAPGLSWLEPSAGLGRILTPIMATRPAAVHAVEIAADCARELFQQFPEVTLSQRDFLAIDHPREGGAGLIVKHTPLAYYDRVVMNPPFHMRADIAHVLHARGFLHRGGVLVGLCMATHHRETALRDLCDHWEEVPAGTFRQSGTDVPCYLFRMTNN